MKINYTLMTCVCLALSVPLAWMFLQRRSAQPPVTVVRVATFNIAMNRAGAGVLLAELERGDCRQAREIAEIVQQNAIDVILLCELDRDRGQQAMNVFADRYLAVPQGRQAGIEFPFRYCGEVNTGEPSGLDLDADGETDGPADAWGFGRFPGQYGMAVLSRHPILTDRIRTFRQLNWSAMPGALRPEGCWSDATWRQLRLSSKSHWDVPVGIGPVADARVVHLLCSHPTPPAFDGEEDRNGCRNHDEIRFWVDYLTPAKADWIVDDAGGTGGLADGESFVILGDLNCDPVDGDARHEAMIALLTHPRVVDPQPMSAAGAHEARTQGGANDAHQAPAVGDTGDFGDKPGQGPGNLRVDYALPSSDLEVHDSQVFWPLPNEPGYTLVRASDHRLVWLDLVMR